MSMSSSSSSSRTVALPLPLMILCLLLLSSSAAALLLLLLLSPSAASTAAAAPTTASSTTRGDEDGGEERRRQALAAGAVAVADGEGEGPVVVVVVRGDGEPAESSQENPVLARFYRELYRQRRRRMGLERRNHFDLDFVEDDGAAADSAATVGLARSLRNWADVNGLLVDFVQSRNKKKTSGSEENENENINDKPKPKPRPSFAAEQQQQQVSIEEERQLSVLRSGGAGEEEEATQQQQQQQLPVVFAHGMGDSCFNAGMQHIANKTGELLGGAYAVCVPTGDTQSEDTENGYFMSWNDNVEVFAAKVRADPLLAARGFHAVGFSQGNNVIRGYVAKYNDPPVKTFLSINGVNAGIGAVPHCRPTSESESDRRRRFDDDESTDPVGDENNFASTEERRRRRQLQRQLSAMTTEPDDGSARGAAGTTVDTAESIVGFSVCDLLNEQASKRAYTEFAQEHSFQANYWRDPRPSALDRYREYSQLAAWNNEIPTSVNQTYKDNWSRTSTFVWVLATEDGMVWPREGEHWGAPDPDDPFHAVLPRQETEWYKKDLFGLKTAETAGKNHYESFVGDHLAFSEEDYDRWVTTYLTRN